jgi:hypothetical protein
MLESDWRPRLLSATVAVGAAKAELSRKHQLLHEDR